MSERIIPRATYRLQLTKDFPFTSAADVAPYLADLGISHAYLSPILKARRGSKHGYDTVDHTLLNPELGTQRDFEEMVAAFRAHGMGVVLDIVPNHMGIGGDENDLWLDVLKWGPTSRYADWFDINWSPSEPALKNRVLVPVLGSSFGEALERGALELRYDEAEQAYAVWAEGTHKLPVRPNTHALIGEPSAVHRFNSRQGRDELIGLISAQHWRPARYSVAADDINYRRFFIVSDLAAIRVERDDVFKHVHALVFDLVAAGLIDGLRIDHIDGLYDPKAYCRRLRDECPRDIYLAVEKILAPHETLRDDWAVDGTTGYEFATAVTQLLTEPRSEDALTKTYRHITGANVSFADEERRAKREIIDYEMAAELDALTVRLRRLAATSVRTADLTHNAIRSALREVVAAMPVYRTYIDNGPLDEHDGRNIAVAVAKARQTTPALDPAVFEFLNEVLTGELCRTRKEYDQMDALEAAKRVQQYSGPVMAKGLEDTALYRYNRLIALNDVGAKPDRFAGSIESFHEFNRARNQRVPNGMLASSSHDSKRGEDARARIAAISGYPLLWETMVGHWRVLLSGADIDALEPNDLYYFFQLLLGSWPTTLAIDLGDDLTAFSDRMQAAMLKSVREARMKTNWSVPKSDYEDAIEAFVRSALSNGPFLRSFIEFESEVAEAGAQNGLLLTALKLTVPGVPDVYQGAELWEQSMVDPDNRRPVDFESRRASLERADSPQVLTRDWRDGAIKQRLIADLLGHRRKHPKLYEKGDYVPLEAGNDVIAFSRRYDNEVLVVALQLYPWRRRVWDRFEIDLPSDLDWTTLESVVGDRPDMGTAGGLLTVFCCRTLPLGSSVLKTSGTEAAPVG